MAQTSGTPTARAVLDFLIRFGPQVAFYQALVLLERAFPGRPPVGEDGPPSREPVRLRPSVSLACPPSDLESIEPLETEGVRVTATFLGLYGVDSPLPYTYAEHIARIASDAAGERVRSFLDLFHHRLYSLLYRAWKKSRPVAAAPGVGDPISDRVLSVVGHVAELGLGGLRKPRLTEVRLRALRARTAAGLQALLRHRLGYACDVEQLQLRAAEVAPSERTRIGVHNSQLGSTLFVGKRIIDRNKIKICVEARSLEQFQALLPEGAERAELDDVVLGYLRDPQDYEVEVKMATELAPGFRLKKQYAVGRTVWLGPPRPFALCRWPGRRAPVKPPAVDSEG